MKKKIKMVLSTVSPILITRLRFFYNFGRFLNLKHPKDVNEKLQYLKFKTYYKNDIITVCVDKLRVREYLGSKGMVELSVPLLKSGGYADANDIRADWDSYPQKFVLKCNHGSGYNILITDKESIDMESVISQLDNWMHEDYWKVYCEPQYRYVKKAILAEEYLMDDIRTYKFYCFNGTPHFVYVSSGEKEHHEDYFVDYFDMEWNWLPISLGSHKHAPVIEMPPKNFANMVEIARILSSDFPFVRIDLYNVDGKIYFSEFTFIPTGGMMKLHPTEVINEWGELLKI